MWIFPWIELSWHSCSMWDKLVWLNWFDNFSVRGCLPLIGKDFITHMHGLAVYVKEGLPFAQDLSIENSVYSYLCFQLVLLHSVSYFFFLFQSPYLYVQFLMLFYLTYMRLSWFVLGNFNIIIKTGQPILVELIHLVNSALLFLSQMILLRWLTFLLRFLTVSLAVLLFWIYLFWC